MDNAEEEKASGNLPASEDKNRKNVHVKDPQDTDAFTPSRSKPE